MFDPSLCVATGSKQHLAKITTLEHGTRDARLIKKQKAQALKRRSIPTFHFFLTFAPILEASWKALQTGVTAVYSTQRNCAEHST